MRTAQKERPTRSSRTAKPLPKKKGEPLKRGVRIQVADLRVGDRIVLRWHGKKIGTELTQEQADQIVNEFLKSGEMSEYVAKSAEVRDITLCPSQWRTHMHVNKMSCYDERGYIWIVERKDDRGH